jgi:uncharacterized Zn-binding protein involved in type VI secretion
MSTTLFSLQSAIVVGPSPGECCCDEYGRVYLRFLWDKDLAGPYNSSLKARVVQQTASRAGGHCWIPLVGDEVLVKFVNADPAQAMVIGSIYQPKDTQPVRFPDNRHRMALLHQEEVGAANGLYFDDDSVHGSIRLTAKRNLQVDAINAVANIGGDVNIKAGNHSLKVSGGGIQIASAKQGLQVKSSAIQMTKNHIAIKSDKVIFKVPGAQSGAMVRLGDQHVCSQVTANIAHQKGALLQGWHRVTVNDKPIARVGDAIQCRVGRTKIPKGETNITAASRPIVQVGMHSEHHGQVITGSPNVFVDGGEMGALGTSGQNDFSTAYVSVDYNTAKKFKADSLPTGTTSTAASLPLGSNSTAQNRALRGAALSWVRVASVNLQKKIIISLFRR